MIDFENTKRVWSFKQKDFTIELVNWRYSVGEPEKWNIYVYVYPQHKWYQTNRHLLVGSNRLSENLHRIDDMSKPPMHGGLTFIDVHPNSIQLGCDYQHDGDEFYSIEIDPYTFEYDVKRLIKWFDDFNPNSEIQDLKTKSPQNDGGLGLSLDGSLVESMSNVIEAISEAI